VSDQTELRVHLPAPDGAAPDQDAEWCVVETAEGNRRIRFHDYDEIFSIPGLYERLFYEELRCTSPTVVRSLLEQVLETRDVDPGDLTVLDVGAGNGMVAEELDAMGAGAIVGVDIIEEAAVAAERDRPGLYDDYRVVDLTDPGPADDAALRDAGFNCLTSVAALGFGDIPPDAFAQALEYVEPGGLVAFTLRDHIADAQKPGSFGAYVRDLHAAGDLEPIAQRRYRHRVSMTGEPLHYVAYVAEKA
jgi:predicted TPR repeat methyltransferase